MIKQPENRKHRHRVSVTTEDVLACAWRFRRGWTAAEIASILGVTERAARAAICWLIIQRSIEPIASNSARDKGKIYVVRRESSCDVSAINKLVMLWA